MARIDRASRDVAASPDETYAALTDPEALVAWLPPEGMTGRFERYDLRPGGSYRLVLNYIDSSVTAGKASADSDIVEARFTELVPGERVVNEIDFESDDPAFAGTMTMTWSLTAIEDGCRVEVTATDVPPGITAEDHATGMESSLANLAAYLQR